MAKKLQDISILDLMPPNISLDVGVQEAAQAFDEVLRDIIAKIPGVAIYSRIGEIVDHALLDMLAWQFHGYTGFFYSNDMELEVKREMVQKALDWFTRKGTPSAVEEVVGVAWGADVEIREWFETGRMPYTFMLDLTRPLPDEESINELIRAIFAVKNTRSWLDLIRSIMEYQYRLYVGVGIFKKDDLTLGLDTPVRGEGTVRPRIGGFPTIAGSVELGFQYGDEIPIIPDPVPRTLTVTNGTGGGEFLPGTVIQVTATAPSGQQFVRWSDGYTSNPRTFVMPNSNVTLTAEFEPIPRQIFSLTVLGGSMTYEGDDAGNHGSFEVGSEVIITADTPPVGQKFDRWSDGNTQDPRTFTMPAHDVTLAAGFVAIAPVLFTLTVVGGTGSGEFEAGTHVPVNASVPANHRFVRWSNGNTNADFLLVMPANNVTLTAEFEAVPAGLPFAFAISTSDQPDPVRGTDFIRGAALPAFGDQVCVGGNYGGFQVEATNADELIIWNSYTHGGTDAQLWLGSEIPAWICRVVIERSMADWIWHQSEPVVAPGWTVSQTNWAYIAERRG